MTDTLARIVNLLDPRKYIDGTTIGKELDITRAAVWKAIKKLENYGIALKSVKGKGYKLKAPLQLLSEKSMKKALGCSNVQLIVLEKTKSTNTYLKEVDAHPEEVTVCVAECQTAGRGRMDRLWHSPFAQNIHLSLRFPFYKDMSELSGLSLLTSLSTIKAIEKVTELKTPLKVKWPNDILADGQKISGNLIELQAESHGFCNVIIGVGINVNMDNAHKKDISQSWTSLRKLTGHYYDRNDLCVALVNTLLDDIEQFKQHGLSYFLDDWKVKDMLLGKPISLTSHQNVFHGHAAGINDRGHLLMTNPDGTQTAFSSGDTTLSKQDR